MIVRDIQDQKIFIVRCVTLVHLKMEGLIDTVLNVIDECSHAKYPVISVISVSLKITNVDSC